MRYGNGRHTYERVSEWATLPDDESFVDVCRVALADNGNVLVLGRGKHPLMFFDSDGEFLSGWGEQYFSDRPHGMCIGPENSIYCTDDGNHTVRKFTPDGDLLMTLGEENEPSETGYRHVPDGFERIASITEPAGPFNRPTGVSVFDSGEIFVSDGYGNARVHEFSSGGELVRSWGQPGPGPGEFRLPHSIHSDDENRLWVTDRENSRIQIFDANGEFLSEWTDLIRPTDLYIDGDTVYVAEICKRVSVFDINGELLARWGNETHPKDDPLFIAPHTIAVDDDGDLYVGDVAKTYHDIDRGARTLQKFENVS